MSIYKPGHLLVIEELPLVIASKSEFNDIVAQLKPRIPIGVKSSTFKDCVAKAMGFKSMNAVVNNFPVVTNRQMFLQNLGTEMNKRYAKKVPPTLMAEMDFEFSVKSKKMLFKLAPGSLGKVLSKLTGTVFHSLFFVDNDGDGFPYLAGDDIRTLRDRIYEKIDAEYVDWNTPFFSETIERSCREYLDTLLTEELLELHIIKSGVNTPESLERDAVRELIALRLIGLISSDLLHMECVTVPGLISKEWTKQNPIKLTSSLSIAYDRYKDHERVISSKLKPKTQIPNDDDILYPIPMIEIQQDVPVVDDEPLSKHKSLSYIALAPNREYFTYGDLINAVTESQTYFRNILRQFDGKGAKHVPGSEDRYMSFVGAAITSHPEFMGPGMTVAWTSNPNKTIGLYEQY